MHLFCNCVHFFLDQAHFFVSVYIFFLDCALFSGLGTIFSCLCTFHQLICICFLVFLYYWVAVTCDGAGIRSCMLMTDGVIGRYGNRGGEVGKGEVVWGGGGM